MCKFPTEYLRTQDREEIIDGVKVFTRVSIQTYRENESKFTIIVLGEIIYPNENDYDMECLEYLPNVDISEMNDKIDDLLFRYSEK